MDAKQPTPGEITGMAAGGVLLVASFLPFYEVDSPFDRSTSWSAWTNDYLIFPTAMLIVLVGVAIAVRIAVARFTEVTSTPLLEWEHLDVVLSSLAFVTALAYAIRDVDPVDRGIGLWLVLLAAAGATVGAFLREREATA